MPGPRSEQGAPRKDVDRFVRIPSKAKTLKKGPFAPDPFGHCLTRKNILPWGQSCSEPGIPDISDPILLPPSVESQPMKGSSPTVLIILPDGMRLPLRDFFGYHEGNPDRSPINRKVSMRPDPDPPKQAARFR